MASIITPIMPYRIKHEPISEIIIKALIFFKFNVL